MRVLKRCTLHSGVFFCPGLLFLSRTAKFCAFVDQHGHGAVVVPLTAVGKGRPQPMPTVRVGAEVRATDNVALLMLNFPAGDAVFLAYRLVVVCEFAAAGGRSCK